MSPDYSCLENNKQTITRTTLNASTRAKIQDTRNRYHPRIDRDHGGGECRQYRGENMYRARLICFSRQACGHAADYTDSPPGYNWSRNRAPGTREHGKYGISLSLSLA